MRKTKQECKKTNTNKTRNKFVGFVLFTIYEQEIDFFNVVVEKI
jgi:hypothetical protein